MKNKLINNTHTFTKTGNICTSVTVTINGYLLDDMPTKQKQISRDGVYELYNVNNWTKGTILETDTYNYSVPADKQWNETRLNADDRELKFTLLDSLSEDSGYINKEESILTKLEAHNG